MYSSKIDLSKKDKLYRALDSYTRSFNRRGVTIMVQAHSDKVGNVEITVNGKKGVAYKIVIVTYDTANQEWIATTDGMEYHLLMLNEVSNIVKSKIQQLSTVITKM